ncbi:MAG: DUF3303 domain-containing protein [Phycisphaerae bacterium]|nr:DUF3303 domain-containing protein [Phycisphaerae bacterium]
MKFMITWKIPPGCHKQAAEDFLSEGAPVPEALATLGRWHVPGSAMGWLLVEGTDGVALAQHAAEWANLLELEISPVIEDEEAATGLARAYGKSN